MPPNSTTLAEDIAATRKVGAATPAPTTPVAGTTAIPPVVEEPHRPAPQFNAPTSGVQSVADQSFTTSQAYCGNTAMYATSAFRLAASSQSVLGFHLCPS